MDLMMLVPMSADQQNSNTYQENPCVEHNCRVPPEHDELKNVIKGNGFCGKARRWFRHKCFISNRHPNARFYLRSSAAISYEYTRHANSFYYMIHPFSEFRIWWESIMIPVTLLALLIIPYRAAFFKVDSHQEWIFIVVTLNGISCIDTVMWFFTGRYDLRTNVVLLNPRLVARKYVRGWFWIDVLSSLPLEPMVALVRRSPQNIRIFSILQIFMIFRLRILIVYGRHLRRVYGISLQMLKCFELLVLMVVVLHWAACIEWYASWIVVQEVLPYDNEYSNWTLLPYVKDCEPLAKYIISLYRAVAAICGCLKYEGLSAVEDILVDSFLTVFGRIANIYLIAQGLQLMNTFRGTNRSYLHLVPQLREFMHHKELPIDIQNRLTTYYEFCTQQGIDLERSIMSLVSPQLRQELMLHRSRKFVEKVALFECLPEAVLSRLAMSLQTEVFLTNDIILKAGTIGHAMYFIVSGTVAIYTSLGKEVFHLEDGAHFGEAALVMENEHRLASVVAVDICELYVLSREDFQKIVDPYPNLMNSLQKLALKRLEKTLFLGELYRLEGNVPDALTRQRKSSGKTENDSEAIS